LVHGFAIMTASICKDRDDPFTAWAESEHPKVLREHKQLWTQAGNREAEYEGLEFTDAQGKDVPDLWSFYLAKVKARFDLPDPDAKRKVQTFKQAEHETPTQAAQRFTDLVRCIRKNAIADDDLATHFFDGLRDRKMRKFTRSMYMQKPVDQEDVWSLKFVVDHAQQYHVAMRKSLVSLDCDKPTESKSKTKAITLSTKEWQEYQELKAWQASSNTTTRAPKSTTVGTSSQPAPQRATQPPEGRTRGAQGGRREDGQRRSTDGRPCTYAKCLGRRAAHSETECWTKQLDEGRVNNQAPPPAYFVEKHKQARA
ncbi:hypothetical protein Vretimale_9109, partial [Volvox reticuliferus]